MKKLVCIIIAISMMLYTYTIAYADVTDYIPDWISYIIDTSQTIIGYDGTDTAYNEYVSNSHQASNYGAMVRALEDIRPNSYIQALFPLAKPYDVIISNTQSAYDGRFRASYVSRDFVDRLYTNVSGYGQNGRYKTLEDYSLVVDSEYDINNNISEYGVFLSQRNDVFTGYIDITNARSYSGVSFYSGSTVPPVMYIGNTGTVYQNGNMLPRNNIYFLMGSNDLIASSTIMNNVCGYMYRYGQQIDQIKLQFLWSSQFNYNNGNYEPNGYQVGQPVIMRNGTSQGGIPDSETATRLQQFETQIGVQLAFTEAPPIEPPENIPYDNDNNVIMLLPINNNNDVTYQDIKYISPTTYKNYYDDGDVTMNDYTYNNDSQYINNAINNYYNYVINNNGSSYDDTTLLGKLDIIIGKLTEIIDTVKNIGTSDVPGVKIFSSTPIYTDFGDCITNNVGLANDIDRINDSIDVTQSERVDGYIDRFKGEYIDTDEPYNGLFDDITVNTDWYEPYRLKVRNILKIPCWIFALFGSWAVVKSVFGVKE